MTTVEKVTSRSELDLNPPTLPEPTRKINLSNTERQLSVGVGVTAIIAGAMRGTLGGIVAAAAGSALVYRGVSGHCMGYQLLGLDTSEEPSTNPRHYHESGIHVEYSLTVERPASELFAFWRDFTNLPKFMRHLHTVQVKDNGHSFWEASGPVGTTVQWEAEIINEIPHELISWRSLGGSEVDNAGSVRFIPSLQGHSNAEPHAATEVRVMLDYIPPAGRVGAFIAKLFGEEPTQQIHEDLRRFKALMETGEIPTISGQSRGSCSYFH